jgi:hypothetical protein
MTRPSGLPAELTSFAGRRQELREAKRLPATTRLLTLTAAAAPGRPGRIHAVGYRSVYLTEPYGRGLIPETFEGYRRQRYRWTYGPVQELQRHWRLFLPGRLAAPSALTGQQKLHHANHGLDVMCIGVRALCFLWAAAAAASMVAH